MAQTTDTLYQHLDLDPHKAVDFALVVAGWPVIYTVAGGDYSIPASGDLSSAEGFTTVRKWANAPTGSAAKVKGLPEDGHMTIGQMDMEVLDVNETGVRALSDLLSRQAYLEDVSTGTETQLNGALTSSATTVVLDSGTGLSEGDVIHISQEAILLGTKSTNTFTGCTRGYLLTSAVAHDDNVKVYGYKPAVYRSKAWVYKGYQGLTLDKWEPAFGGVITGHEKLPGKVRFSIRSTTWETYANKRRKIQPPKITDGYIYGNGELTTTALENDFTCNITIHTDDPTKFNSGHWMIKIANYWFGIAASSSSLVSGDQYDLTLTLVKGLSNTEIPELNNHGNGNGPEAIFGWSAAVFTSSAAQTGVDPVNFLLQILTSRLGDSANGSYDVLPEGLGLGIPADMIDTASFTAIKAEYDYDTNARLFLAFTEAVDAKEFIENELCRPFGWYLRTGNDGRISLVRPKHPQKFHTSRGNNVVTFTAASGGTAYTPTITSGVRTGAEIATAVQTAMNSVSSGFAVSYDTGTNLFSVTRTGGTWDLTNEGTAQSVWNALGFTTNRTGAASGVAEVADEARGGFTETDFNVVTDDDIWDVRPIDTQPLQIGEVRFTSNYDWQTREFGLTKVYIDAEITNLFSADEQAPYEIESKGLLINNTDALTKGKWPWSFWKAPSSGCDPTRVDVSTSYGLDATNSWASLRASMMFDRYRHPPIRFKSKLHWKFNSREVGDVLRINSYAIDGVFTDYERNTTTLTNRLFELTALKPNFAGGYLEAEWLGFRYVSY